MADGDITAVKILYRHPFGGGRDDAGLRVNEKVLVVGEITATYVSGGIAVNKMGGVNCFGLTNLDFLKLETVLVTTTSSDAEAIQIAGYDTVNQKIFIVEDEGAATPAVPSNADAIKLRFLAIGDNAEAPVLT